MEPRISFITLGVSDLDRATHFYQDVLKLPRIHMPPGANVSFFEMGKTWLSLFERKNLAADCFGTSVASSMVGAETVPAVTSRTRCSADTVSATDAGVASEGFGFAGFTLAHNLRSIEDVDALFAELTAAGVRIVKPPHRTDWGGYSGYFADPDDFLWELAWNPQFPHV